MNFNAHQNIDGDHKLWKGLIAGMIGGLVASWTMNQFQVAASKWSERESKKAKDQPDSQHNRESQPKHEEQEPATVKAASGISEHLLHHRLTAREKKIAGPAVHYGFGTAMGGLYGALAEAAPRTTSAGGLPFGAALWLTADETAVPAFRLSQPPTKSPISTHINALLAHLVYGFTTEMVRRVVRRI